MNMTITCQAEDSVSDAEFGYWDGSWGDPPIHTFACDEPAVAMIDEVAVCSRHLEGATLPGEVAQ